MDCMYLNYFTSDHNFPFFIQYGYHDYDMPEHYHYDFFELVIVLNGNARHIINSEESFIKKGDVFVFYGDVSHGYIDPQTFKIINIMYRPEQIYEVRNDLKKSSGYQALFVLEPFYRKDHKFSNTLSLPISGLEYIAELGAAIDEEYKSRIQGYQTMIYARFMEIVVYLSRQYEIQMEHSQNNFIHFAKAVSFMEDNYLKPIKLDELAAIANLSARHFNRVFKENYKTTPIDYIIKLRLDHACFLLKKNDVCITEVAEQSGFDDSNYFTRQFKKYMGITPKEYHKNFKFNIHYRISH